MVHGDSTLHRASHHLFYEAAMLLDTCHLLSQRIFSGPAHNALVESFVVHFRSLLRFFYAGAPADKLPTREQLLKEVDGDVSRLSVIGKPKGSFGHSDRDVQAADYFVDPSNWWKTVRTMTADRFIDYQRANKQVAHLTVERLKQDVVGSEVRSKLWPAGDIAMSLAHTLDEFYRHAPDWLLDKESKYDRQAWDSYAREALALPPRLQVASGVMIDPVEVGLDEVAGEVKPGDGLHY